MISVVAPVFNESENLLIFYEDLKGLQKNNNYLKNLELIFIDDGSTDDSKQIIKNLIVPPKYLVVVLH